MKQISKLLIAVILFTAITPTLRAQVNKQDSLALVDLYSSTKGTKWLIHSNWLTKEPVSSWYGITVNNNRVTAINLSQNILNGYIPITLGNLTELASLTFDNNKLSDTIPNSFGNLTNLIWLSLYSNQLSGTIPNSLGNLVNLQHLDLGFNLLVGIIPESVSSLSKLTYLFLSSNNLIGSIPSSLGNLQNLTWLYLYNNHFTDTIPSSLGNLSQLTRLIIFGNKLSGRIPSSLGNLKYLETLHLFNNQLSGSIPTSLNNLAYLTTITIYGNKFTFNGMEDLLNQFPYSVEYSPQATVPLVNNNNTLSVSVGGTPSNNTFKWYKDSKLVATKVGDSTYTAIADGKYWVVATNAIATQLTLYSDTVTINSFINNQDSLALVDFYNSTNGANWKDNSNWLTAKPLNTWKGIVLDSSGRVSEINLYINNLTGKLPASIGNLTNLTTISLHINSIGGNIPPSIGRLTNLKELDLGENVFTGTIPDSLANLTKLTQLDLSINELTGSIPSWIGNFTNLQNLWLQYNYLSDSIPSSIGNLTGLQYLVLQNNQLSGPIPASFGNLSKLKGLFLQNNKFTFDGMELIATKFPFAEYAPQATIPIYKVMIPEGGPVGLSVEVGGTPVNNTYNWYNDSRLIASINKYPFYDASVSGYYYVHVTNSLVPGLTLYSDTVKVDVIMPVKSIYLQTKTINGQILVQWKTINELNAKSFTIQHSTDGVTFTDINTKEAMGSGSNNYSLTDKLPTGSINYYRIEAVDKDGSFTYSNVALLTTYDSRLTTFTVVPNPVRDVVTIKGSHIALVQVIDNMGKVISNTSLKDATNPTLSVSGLAAGNYLLHLKTTTGEQQVVKFVKE